MKRGLTLVEIMAVVLIFTFLFAGLLAALSSSDRSWRIGRNKLIEQQEARKAMDNLIRFLRQSSADWESEQGQHYYLTIDNGAKRIDFYIPVFYPDCCPSNCAPDDSACRDTEGNLHGQEEYKLKKITFSLDAADRQLSRREGSSSAVAVANYIKDINFNLDGASVTAVITAEKEKEFVLKTEALLRNQRITLPEDVEVEQPPEGEQ